jgi:hypothetical protein
MKKQRGLAPPLPTDDFAAYFAARAKVFTAWSNTFLSTLPFSPHITTM